MGRPTDSLRRLGAVVVFAVALAACGGGSTPTGSTPPPGSTSTPGGDSTTKTLKVDFSKVNSCSLIPKAAIERFYGRSLPVVTTNTYPLQPLLDGTIEICIHSDKQGDDARGVGIGISTTTQEASADSLYMSGYENVSNLIGHPAGFNPEGGIIAVVLDKNHVLITVYSPADKTRAISFAKFVLGYIV